LLTLLEHNRLRNIGKYISRFMSTECNWISCSCKMVTYLYVCYLYYFSLKLFAAVNWRCNWKMLSERSML
jgi:hypothetical protein